MNYKTSITALLIFMAACGQEPVEQSPQAGQDQNATPVYAQEVKRGPFNHYLNIQGTVESDKTILISPKTTATVTRINVRAGDKVEQGEVLATLDGDITESQISEVETQLELARTLYEKQKNLREQGIGSEVEFLQAENQVNALEKQLNTLTKQYNNYTIRATIAGTVNQVLLKEGETVNMGSPVFQIANAEALKVTAEVSEAYISTVDQGDSVAIMLPSLDITHNATLDVVSKVIDASNRTFSVEIYIPNYGGRIRPNMVAKVRINDFSEDDQIVIPINLVTEEVDSQYVYVAQQQDSGWTAELRTVTTGKYYKNQVVITSGLNEGDLLVTNGYNTLSAGKAIAIKD